MLPLINARNPALPLPFCEIEADTTKLIAHELTEQDKGHLRSTCHSFHTYRDFQSAEDIRHSYLLIDAQFIPSLKMQFPTLLEPASRNWYIEKMQGGKKVLVSLEELRKDVIQRRLAIGYYDQVNAQTRELALTIAIELNSFQKLLQRTFHDIDSDIAIRKQSDIIEFELVKQSNNKIKANIPDDVSCQTEQQIHSIFRIKRTMLKLAVLDVQLNPIFGKKYIKTASREFFQDGVFVHAINNDINPPGIDLSNDLAIPTKVTRFYLEEYVALGYSSCATRVAPFVYERQSYELYYLEDYFNTQQTNWLWNHADVESVMLKTKTEGLILASQIQGVDLSPGPQKHKKKFCIVM